MMNCPQCRALIPEDSLFCDQCGKALMFCPECRRPRRGTMCAVCGSPLLSAEAFFGCAPENLSLCGEGLRLPLKEGGFGRRGGIWPELSSFEYVSGLHGRISKDASGWKITDEGSTNGTSVNGKPLLKGVPCPISKGDTIEIATSKFKVE